MRAMVCNYSSAVFRSLQTYVSFLFALSIFPTFLSSIAPSRHLQRPVDLSAQPSVQTNLLITRLMSKREEERGG